jgi:ferredoxin
MTDQDKTAQTPAAAPQTTHQVGKYQVQVIRDKCIGAASCVAIAPGTFELDEEGLAKIINGNGSDDDEMKLLAAQSCPTAAIVVIDTTSGEQVWPK